MKLKDTLAVAGKPGLFKFISQGRNGIIVESITDNKRMLVPSSSKVSALADIAIYTETEEVPLKEVLKKIFTKENGQQAVDHKSPEANLKDYFELVLPDYDKNRVYGSDIKKVISWYNLLTSLNLFDPDENEEEAEETATGEKEAKTAVKAKGSPQKGATPKNSDKKPSAKASAQTKNTAAKSKSAGTGKKPSA
ncbi:MAG: DUF5606 domain-containing protein [Bacteroidales bacterium]|nr:DUF5606 domain-containing protein [Bacteroidales bacterium]